MYEFLLLASCILFVGVCIAYVRQEAASLLHPASIYLAFHGFIFVIRPLFAWFYKFDLVYRVYDFQPSMADKITVILGANLAMVVFVAVSLKVASVPSQPVATGGFDRLRRAMVGPMLLVSALLVPLAVAAQLENWNRRIDPYATMARDAATGIMVNVEGNGWFSESALVLGPLAVLAVWLLRFRASGWLLFLAASLLMLGSGGRGSFIFAAAAVAFLFLLERRRSWFDWRVMAIAAISFLTFNAVVVDRGAAIRGVLGGDAGDTYTSAMELDPLEHMDFASLEYFEYIVYAVPQRTGSWDYFAHNLQIFTEPVPRALWKDKPIGSPVQFFKLWDYGTPIGMTISMPGAGWMSLGYFGLIIQAAIFAMLYGGAHSRLLTRNDDAMPRLYYALFAATSIVVFRDGILLTLLRQLPFYLGPLVLIHLLVRLKSVRAARIPAQSHSAPVQTPAERRRELASRAS
ncbi:hypothetical protein [Qipengyuania soli]|uniref:Oligosaccharide repeat unit polymerase n=1 Tax=Qipengyuania soli TaxID=2782568 RepID=A0A7S8IUN4_9SPHN|nr:hypothetical protein [Qipengyuania soli]QPC99214.1 hypothetical protein IRL76_01110 [Qipengyuania soli]